MAEQVTVFTPPKSAPVNPSPAAIEHRTEPVKSAAQVAGTQSHEPTTPARQAWDEQRARADQMLGTVPDSHMVTRGDDGRLAVVPRNGGSEAAPPEPGQPGRQQPQPTEAGPASVDGGKLAIGNLRLSADDIKGILAEKAARDSRAANTPGDR